MHLSKWKAETLKYICILCFRGLTFANRFSNKLLHKSVSKQKCANRWNVQPFFGDHFYFGISLNRIIDLQRTNIAFTFAPIHIWTINYFVFVYSAECCFRCCQFPCILTSDCALICYLIHCICRYQSRASVWLQCECVKWKCFWDGTEI